MEGDDNCYDIKHGLLKKKTCFQCQSPETLRTVLCRRPTVLGNDDARAAPCFCVGLLTRSRVIHCSGVKDRVGCPGPETVGSNVRAVGSG